MNCQRFEDVVSELARGQMMDADLQRESLDHAENCRQCMLRLGDEETLSRGFKALKLEMQLLEAPSAVESRLLEAFRKPTPVQPAVAGKNLTRYWLTAVAALLLIVLGVVAMRMRTETPRQEVTETQPPKSEKNENVATVDQKPEAPQKTDSVKPVSQKRRSVNYVAKARSKRSTQEQNVAANHAVSEVATDFVPLGYMNAATFQEGGQIVRVELPRATLANFGFPVNMDRYNEKVKADILLGADGLAHAIRFVK